MREKEEKQAEQQSVEQKNQEPKENLRQEVEKLRQENAELQDKLMRLAAEFDNFRKRQQKILENMIEQERNNVIGRLLEIAADVDRALEVVESGGEPRAIYDGIRMVARRIKELLRLEGIEVVDPTGQPFDPLEHEAVGVRPVEDEELNNVVLETYQPAYKREGRLISPAKVVVGQYQKTQETKEDENGTE
ncbi:nucleotide exchange factor GrpE [bacterium]|nr:nucleotide exchange factor GrpE [bacterium]